MANRTEINRSQRIRRAHLNRIDYHNVNPAAKRIIDAQRSHSIQGTASAILNRIVCEWAKVKGFKVED